MGSSLSNSGDYALVLALSTFCFVDMLSGFSFAMMHTYIKSEWYNEIRHRTVLNRKVPGWLFGLVWPTIYACNIAAIYITVTTAPTPYDLGINIVGWVFLANTFVNKLWSPIFFVLHQSLAAIGLIVALIGTNATIHYYLWTEGQTTPFYLFVPYTAWLLFALGLSIEWYHYERYYEAEKALRAMAIDGENQVVLVRESPHQSDMFQDL